MFLSGEESPWGRGSLMHGTTCESLRKHPELLLPLPNNAKWSPWIPAKSTEPLQKYN